MTINHTYMFDGNNYDEHSFNSSMPPARSKLIEDFNLNEYFNPLSCHEHKLVNNVTYNLAINQYNIAESIVVDNLKNANTKVCAKILYNLLQNYTKNLNLLTVDESIYINTAINSFVDVLFSNCDLVKDGNFTELEGDSRIKPDLKYSSIIKQTKMDFLVIEVKCPNTKSDDDLFKLSIEMKIILNRLINTGIDSPIVFGLLIHGFTCDIFKMDLIAPSIYRMIKIRSCFVPCTLNDFDVIRITIPSLSQLRTLVLKEVEKAKKSTKKK